MHPKLKMVHPVNDGDGLHKKINHDNFRFNVYEYYSEKRNALSNGGVGGGGGASVRDRYHSVAMKTTLSVNSKPAKAFDRTNYTYDESALSRCALLFIGSLCQQGESCAYHELLLGKVLHLGVGFLLKFYHHYYYFHFAFFLSFSLFPYAILEA